MFSQSSDTLDTAARVPTWAILTTLAVLAVTSAVATVAIDSHPEMSVSAPRATVTCQVARSGT